MSELWESTYRSKQAMERSWTQEVPPESLELLERVSLRPDDPLIDIGGGASVLAEVLVSRAFGDITVLDISPSAIAESRDRIETISGVRSGVEWIVADVTTFVPTRSYALWHDRAVFHFLVDPRDQERYVECAAGAVAEGGSLIIATFSPDGPEMCSGLPVRRWSSGELATRFATSFDAVEHFQRDHRTPWGATQSFTWMLMRRRESRVRQ